MSTDKPRRRWFRYSLRTIFVLLTIVACAACWLRVQLQWIRDRQDAMHECFALRYLDARAPMSLHILGEKGWAEVWIAVRKGAPYREWKQAERRISRLFPESQVYSRQLPIISTEASFEALMAKPSAQPAPP